MKCTVNEAAKNILMEIQQLLEKKKHLLVAIDGRCAAGKTTIASMLKELCNCNVIHMDHFFLRPEQRTKERLLLAGGNTDVERFYQEVLLPLKAKEAFSYQPYDCQTQKMAPAIYVPVYPVNIVEGSYACHPKLQKYYDLKIFLTIDESEQLRRIECRNGKTGAVLFKEKWIPLEEKYFLAYSIEEHADLCIQI